MAEEYREVVNNTNARNALVVSLSDALLRIVDMGNPYIVDVDGVLRAEWRLSDLILTATGECDEFLEVMARDRQTHRVGFARWSAESIEIPPDLLWVISGNVSCEYTYEYVARGGSVSMPNKYWTYIKKRLRR